MKRLKRKEKNKQTPQQNSGAQTEYFIMHSDPVDQRKSNNQRKSLTKINDFVFTSSFKKCMQ